MKHSLNLIAFVAVAVVVVGCGSTPPPAGTSAVGIFVDGRYAEAQKRFERAIEKDERNAVLNHCRAASAALARSDFDAAWRHLREADIEMEDLTAKEGETTTAIVVDESTKRFKGEPHERAMVSVYGGLVHWRRGDWGNALAGFKNAALRDSDVEENAYKADVPLHYIMAGRLHLILGETGQAEQAFRRAAELAPKNPFARIEAHLDANLMLICDLGEGPFRYRKGRHGQVSAFARSRYDEVAARVIVDGKVLGETVLVADLFREATTRGHRAIEGILAGKAIFKDVAVVGGALILNNAGKTENVLVGAALIAVGLATSAKADVRYWETLPGEVHLWTGRLEPGRSHDVRVEFIDGEGKRVPGLRIYRAHIRVDEDDEILLYARSGPGTESTPLTSTKEKPE